MNRWPETSSSLTGAGMAPLIMWASWNTAKMVLFIPWRETQVIAVDGENILSEAQISMDMGCRHIEKG